VCDDLIHTKNIIAIIQVFGKREKEAGNTNQ
jgi:hypothetical protein